MLLVPFHVPQAPSFCQRFERTAVSDDDDLRSRVCGVGLAFVDGTFGGPLAGLESAAGKPRLLRARD